MTHSSVGEQGHCVARWPWACHAAKPTSASPARTPRAEPASPDYLPLPRRCPEHTPGRSDSWEGGCAASVTLVGKAPQRRRWEELRETARGPRPAPGPP